MWNWKDVLTGVLIMASLGLLAWTAADCTVDAAERIKIGGKAAVTAAKDVDESIHEKAYRVANLETQRQRDKRFSRERRDMGATVRNVRKIMKDLRAEGELSNDIGIARQQVAQVLMEENPQAFMDADAAVKEFTKGFRTDDGEELGFDWDSFLAFIQQLMEIIMTWINLFSDTTPIDPGLVYVPPVYQLVA